MDHLLKSIRAAWAGHLTATATLSDRDTKSFIVRRSQTNERSPTVFTLSPKLWELRMNWLQAQSRWKMLRFAFQYTGERVVGLSAPEPAPALVVARRTGRMSPSELSRRMTGVTRAVSCRTGSIVEAVWNASPDRSASGCVRAQSRCLSMITGDAAGRNQRVDGVRLRTGESEWVVNSWRFEMLRQALEGYRALEKLRHSVDVGRDK